MAQSARVDAGGSARIPRLRRWALGAVHRTDCLQSEIQNPKLATVRYPRLVPLDAACAKELKKRTLTNLYNQRPAWLDLAHRRLDEAVFAAYGWPPTLTDDELLARLLELNLARSDSPQVSSSSSSPSSSSTSAAIDSR